MALSEHHGQHCLQTPILLTPPEVKKNLLIVTSFGRIEMKVVYMIHQLKRHLIKLHFAHEQLSKPGKLQPSGLNLVCRQQWRHCSHMYVSEVRVTCLRSWTYQ